MGSEEIERQVKPVAALSTRGDALTVFTRSLTLQRMRNREENAALPCGNAMDNPEEMSA